MESDYWPGGAALGKRIRLPGEHFEREIVGVARNANYTALAEPAQPCVYVPLEQHYSDAMTLYIKSKEDPQTVINTVTHEVHTVLPEVALTDIRTGRKLIDQALTTARMGVSLLTVLGLLALALASIGLYCMLAYSVNRRRQEIGVRMALGAAQGRVLMLIFRQGMSIVAVGIALGLVGALAAGQMLRGMLFGVGIADPVSMFGATVILMAVAVLACSLPAYRASKLDPLPALRAA